MTPAIDGFTARITQSMEGREGLAYRGVIRRSGKKVGEFYNDGNGGCDDFSFDRKEDREAFYQSAEKHVPETSDFGFGGPPIKVSEKDSFFLGMLLGDA